MKLGRLQAERCSAHFAGTLVVFREIGRLLANTKSSRLSLERQGDAALVQSDFLPAMAIAGFFSATVVVTQSGSGG
jgi:hypothetical protein